MAALPMSRDPPEDESRFSFPDPAIKLFGRTILLPVSTTAASVDACIPGSSVKPLGCTARVVNTQDESKFEPDEECLSPRGVDELGTTSGNSAGSDEEELSSPSLSKHSIIDGTAMDALGAEASQDAREDVEKDKSSLGVAEDKRLRKPEKVAPCPRCSSLDTKFCYFNNYNVNQPRHFCKCCQRYWTDGGTLRNVPVGAGRRKNKHGSQQKQPLPDTVFLRREDHDVAQPLLPCSLPHEVGWTSDVLKSISSAPVLHFPPSLESLYFTDSNPTPPALTTPRLEIPFPGNMVSNLVFGAGAVGGQSLPIYDSYRDVEVEAEVKSEELLQLHPKSFNDSIEVGNITEATVTTVRDGKDDCACSSTTSLSETALNSNCDGRTSAKLSSDCKISFPSPFLGLPWPYTYMSWAGAGCSSAGGDHSSQMPYPNASQISIPPSVRPADCLWQWPHFPGAMWSPTGCCLPWTLPVAMTAAPAPAPAAPPPPAFGKAYNSGKRPRASSEGMDKGSLCIPKTLRIQDPEEAAQSSILATLGVDAKSGSLSSTGIFSAFQPKAEVFQPKPGSRLSRGGQSSANAAVTSGFIAFHEGK